VGCPAYQPSRIGNSEGVTTSDQVEAYRRRVALALAEYILCHFGREMGGSRAEVREAPGSTSKILSCLARHLEFTFYGLDLPLLPDPEVNG
jgi:hypothetical protein